MKKEASDLKIAAIYSFLSLIIIVAGYFLYMAIAMGIVSILGFGWGYLLLGVPAVMLILPLSILVGARLAGNYVSKRYAIKSRNKVALIAVIPYLVLVIFGFLRFSMGAIDSSVAESNAYIIFDVSAVFFVAYYFLARKYIK